MFDIHTHQLSQVPNPDAILNVYWNEVHQRPQGQPFSLSVHPWYLNTADVDIDWDRIAANFAGNPDLWAIGECGLDKNTDFSLDFQISVLDAQYYLAQKLKKPMIIHCVRAFDQLLEWKKGKDAVPMLVHGFTRKEELFRSLIKSGFYVSFGFALCQHRPPLMNLFMEVPLEWIFLETDDQIGYSIEDIYRAAAQYKYTSVPELQTQININKNKFFNFSI